MGKGKQKNLKPQNAKRGKEFGLDGVRCTDCSLLKSDMDKPAWRIAYLKSSLSAWPWPHPECRAENKGCFDKLYELEERTLYQLRTDGVMCSYERSKFEQLSSRARKALNDDPMLNQADEIYRFKVTPQKRFFAIREPNTNVFDIVWWDPKHEVWPSEK